MRNEKDGVTNVLRVLAHLALDHRRDRLHRALHVDAAFRVAGQIERLGELVVEAIAVGHPDGADAADMAAGVAGTSLRPEAAIRQHRIVLAALAAPGSRRYAL